MYVCMYVCMYIYIHIWLAELDLSEHLGRVYLFTLLDYRGFSGTFSDMTMCISHCLMITIYRCCSDIHIGVTQARCT
jgi:hypothetical protein